MYSSIVAMCCLFDRLMPRTARRPTAAGRIAPADALGVGVTLAIMSVMVMGLGVNWVAG